MPQIFGADYRGLAGWPYYTVLLHMVSLALVGLALLVAARRFFCGAALVDQLLAVAIAGNIVLFVLTSAGSEGPHEIAVVAPFGAALAARMLASPQASRARTGSAPARRARAVAYGAGLVVLLGYLGGLAHEVVQPAAPPDNSQLASWLEAHHLRYGLGGYWESSIVTVETGGQVKVRALLKSTMGPDLWQAEPSWYDPAVTAGQLHRAVQRARLPELGAPRPDKEVLRPSGAGVPRRPLHRDGVGQEPAAQHPALGGSGRPVDRNPIRPVGEPEPGP